MTSPARSTVNPAIFRASSSAEKSSSDVICRTKGGMFLVFCLAPAKAVGTGMSTSSRITSIMSADTLTAPSSFLSIWRVNRRWADRGTGCPTGSWARGEQIGRVHAGVLVWAVVRSTPPPESGGWSLLLIRAADRPFRISRRFPPGVVLLPGVVKSSHSDHPPFLLTIRATCKEI